MPDSISKCALCPEDYYCEMATNYRYQNPCPGGHYCPRGSGAPIKCEAGTYCRWENDMVIQDICP